MPRKKSKRGSQRKRSSQKPGNPKLFTIRPSKGAKKYEVFLPKNGRVRKVSFGAKGYSDFTIHKDKARRSRYRSRHSKDKINDPYSPGFWAWHALWGESSNKKTSFAAAVRKARKLVK